MKRGPLKEHRQNHRWNIKVTLTEQQMECKRNTDRNICRTKTEPKNEHRRIKYKTLKEHRRNTEGTQAKHRQIVDKTKAEPKKGMQTKP